MYNGDPAQVLEDNKDTIQDWLEAIYVIRNSVLLMFWEHSSNGDVCPSPLYIASLTLVFIL